MHKCILSRVVAAEKSKCFQGSTQDQVGDHLRVEVRVIKWLFDFLTCLAFQNLAGLHVDGFKHKIKKINFLLTAKLAENSRRINNII